MNDVIKANMIKGLEEYMRNYYVDIIEGLSVAGSGLEWDVTYNDSTMHITYVLADLDKTAYEFYPNTNYDRKSDCFIGTFIVKFSRPPEGLFDGGCDGYDGI